MRALGSEGSPSARVRILSTVLTLGNGYLAGHALQQTPAGYWSSCRHNLTFPVAQITAGVLAKYCIESLPVARSVRVSVCPCVRRGGREAFLSRTRHNSLINLPSSISRLHASYARLPPPAPGTMRPAITAVHAGPPSPEAAMISKQSVELICRVVVIVRRRHWVVMQRCMVRLDDVHCPIDDEFRRHLESVHDLHEAETHDVDTNTSIPVFDPVITDDDPGAQRKLGNVEHIAILRLLTTMVARRKRKKLFVTFEDFSKAYDLLPLTLCLVIAYPSEPV
ncbi:hypothetical protein E2C01_044439 [Portunus trituberculatus]|uniref:Uncharacterized protein n=1 Tax=Portunus trituberculatus TaxID=210409 RepID=A0A5B7FS63_PORTR|nr:hypothetical protein [Portunus trituberculatus]